MSRPEENGAVAIFLNQVCSHVRAKELHPEIREELSSHIVEQMEMLQENGMSVEAAAAEAICQMGDPALIGRNFHQAHKPVMEWKLVVILALMALIGIFGVFTAQESGMYPQFGTSLIERKVLFTLLGLAFLVGFYFVDYCKLQKYSGVLFFGALVLMAYAYFAEIDINGRRVFLVFGPFSINAMAASLPVLLFALAGMKPAKEWRGGWEYLIQLVYRGILPIMLFVQSSSWFYGLIYLIGFLLLTWVTKKNTPQFLVLVLPLLSLYILVLTRVGQLQHRLQAFLYPTSDDSYQIIQTKAAIVSAGWFGHGFAAQLDTLPYVYSDSLFPYLVYCFGWGSGILITGLVICFIIRFWKMNVLIQDVYAKRIMLGWMAVYAIRMLWPILMAFGIVPIVGEVLPFIGYSGMMQVVDFAAAGLLLSLFRRKNMIPGEIENPSLHPN